MDNILETFREIFQDKLGEDQIERAAAELTMAVLVKIIDAAGGKLSEAEKDTVREYLQQAKADEILSLVKSKYTDQEWQAMMEHTVQPLLEEYLDEVVPK
jgi:hypothetical protein